MSRLFRRWFNFGGKKPVRKNAGSFFKKANIKLEALEDRSVPAAISLTSPSTYQQNFNTLATSGTSSVLPAGWELLESGSSSNTTYSAGTGSSTTGDTYSFATAALPADRALGTLLSGAVNPIIGASFKNDTGAVISSLTINYSGEQYRLGVSPRPTPDSLAFSYSLNATGLSTGSGTWVGVTGLNFTAPITSGTVGAIDGNGVGKSVISPVTISGLSIPAGATFWIRWTDTDIASSDDGLAVDDFSLTVNTKPVLTHNTGMRADLNATSTITSTQLQVTDLEQGAAVVFTVGTPPSVGTLQNDGVPLGAGGTFTQGDINTGKITYVAPATDGTDSFTFTATDGTTVLSSTTFAIDLNEVPVLVHPGPGDAIFVNPLDSVAISDYNLLATDADDLVSAITYTVVSGPLYGTLTKNGVPVTSFTQADVDVGDIAGAIRYTRNSEFDSGLDTDLITLSLSDGSSTPIVFDLMVLATAFQPASVDPTLFYDFSTYQPFPIPANGTNLPQFTVSEDGWLHRETGVDASSSVAYDDGHATAGNTYYYGTTDSSERAFGMLTSPNVPTISIYLGVENTSDTAASSLVISFTGEQWRRGGGGTGRMVFSYSTDATDQYDGTYTPFPALDFVAPENGAIGALDGNDFNNQTFVTATLTGLNLSTQRILLRWTMSDASGDGLALDDVTVTLGNLAPTVVTNLGGTIEVGQTLEITSDLLTSTDPEQTAAELTYSLVTIPSVGSLMRDGVALAVNDTFTQEDIDNDLITYLAGAGTTNVLFDFVVSDGEGGATPGNFSINIFNSGNQQPTNITLTPSGVEENKDPGTLVGTFTTTDPDVGDVDFTYEIFSAGGDIEQFDNTLFTVVGDQLFTTATFDFETRPFFTLLVRTNDGHGGLFFKQMIINNINVNEVPIDMFLSSDVLVENAGDGAAVGMLSATDTDIVDTFTFSLEADVDDNNFFDISGDLLVARTSLDFESQSSYTVTVTATDSGGFSITKQFTITVTDANDAPDSITLVGDTLPENAGAAVDIGVLSATDQDAIETLTISLPGGVDDNDFFTLVGGDTLQAVGSFDFETKASYTVTVRVTDAGGLFLEQQFTIFVTDVNEPPTDITLSTSTVAENTVTVGTVIVSDPDAGDTFTISLPAGVDDNDSFTLVGDVLQATSAFDFETKSSYTITVDVTDAAGLPFSKQLTITVTNANEAPFNLALTGDTIAENAGADAVVGTLSATDLDAGDSFSFSLPAGVGANNLFNISGNQLRANASFDFETQTSYSVTVRVTDVGGAFSEKTFLITVTNVNEDPTDLALSNDTIEENAGADAVVGTLLPTDPDAGDTFTYTLVAGQGDNHLFNISGDELRANASFNFEVQASYSVTIEVKDAGGLTFEKTFTITVTDVNDAPANIALVGDTLAENSGPGAVIGTVSATDEDPTDVVTFSLPALGDNGFFNLVGEFLTANGSLDFEFSPTYTVIVRATDNHGLSSDRTFTIHVTNVNEAPTDILLDDALIEEDAAPGTEVGILSTVDPDAGDAATFELVAGQADNNLFTITGNSLTANVTFDVEVQDTYTVVVLATDAGGLSFQTSITITVFHVNQAPTDITLDNSTIAENAGPNAVIGELGAVDADSSPPFTFTLPAGVGQNNLFNISGTTLRANNSFDFETPATYSVTVLVTDSSGDSFEKAFVITVTDVNEPPSDVTITNASVPENAGLNAFVGTLAGVDPDAGDSVTLSLPAGVADNDFFHLVGNDLVANDSFDREAKATYSVSVHAIDESGLPFDKTITITVANVNEDPTDIALNDNLIAENAGPLGAVGTLSATDPDVGDTFTFSLPANVDDNNLFSVSGTTLQANASLDFETDSSYTVTVLVTDFGGLTFQKTFTITVTNVNEPPTDITLTNASIPENSAAPTVIGTLLAADPDAGDTATFVLTSTTGDNAFFEIVGGVLRAKVSLDRELQSTYTVSIRATDALGLTFDDTVVVTVTNVNETPTDITLVDNLIPENAGTNGVVGVLGAVDPDVGDTFTFTLPAGVGDNNLFDVVGGNLVARASFDHEGPTSYSVTVHVADFAGLSTEKTFTITVTNINESPTDIALSATTIQENSAPNTVIGVLSATDPDAGDTFTFTLPENVGDNDLFNINGTQLRANGPFNLEVKSSYSITVLVTDAGGQIYQESFTITVTNVNETPTNITLVGTSVAENSAINTVVGVLSAADPDAGDTFTFSLPSGTPDNSQFNINGTQLRTSAVFNLEAKPSYQITVRVTDLAGLSFDKSFTITVTNVNESPTDITINNATVPENSAVNTPVGVLSAVDPDVGDTFTFTLPAGVGDNNQFNLSGTQLRTSAVFDREVKSSYSVTVHVVDALGLSFEKTLTITVTNVNEAPTDITLSNATVAENSPGATVGLLAGVDPDLGDTFTFSLPAVGDNANFTLIGNSLRASTSFDREVKSSYSVTVHAVDAGGLPIDRTFTITVTNVNEAPTNITLTGNTIVENAGPNAVVGTLSGADPDASDTFTFSLPAGVGDNSAFNISGTSLRATASLDFETKSSYSVTVRVTDAGGLFFDKVFAITVTNGAEPPSDISLTNASVAENQPINAAVGSFGATDQDVGSSFTFSLPAGVGDNAQFNLNANALRTSAVFNREVQSSYTITVRATDNTGLFFDKVFTITVSNVNEQPTALNISATSVPEAGGPNAVIATLTLVDPDVGDTAVFSLPTGSGDNAQFNISGNSLRSNNNLDFETKTSYSLVIRGTDSGGLIFERVVTITVTAVNEPPSNINLSKTTVAENAGVNAVVGTLSAADPDAGNTVFTFSLPAGVGDNASFNISGITLRASAPLDFETKSSYSVTVRATDAGGQFLDKVFTITVTDTNDNMTPDEKYVKRLYNDILFRDPAPEEISAWLVHLAATGNRTVLSNGVLNSVEAVAIQVTKYYQDYLRRDPEPGGVQSFINAYLQGADLEDLKYALLSSQEYYDRISGGTNTGFLNQLYQDVLGRAPDPVGLAGFTAQLDSGRPRGQVIPDVVKSTEGHTILVTGWYDDYLHRPIDPVSLGWVQVLDNGGDYNQILVGILASDEYYLLP